MNSKSAQKFIAKNRSPRVQIEYDVEVYGTEKKIELPFVMGVFADLAGKSKQELPSIADRAFMEIDADNFDDRMKSIKPRVAFNVDNRLEEGGTQLGIEMEFEKMEDFSPEQIAQKIDPLKQLLDARTELSNLLSYMDGKAGAEDLIDKILSDNELLQSLATLPKNAASEDNNS
ncbi:type VI secretion system contractile sheath small subunit [Moraxella bovis]|uniref:type VI secretion system contractile sheath small subunit n=1 Tax=Moraxella bovis TaxID=476 RepID=UPI002227EEC9|nr:type VI secretion system contractile sheath small subunit [Moraxella bovis]UYZ95791.1 type VI secretion system contractile sheath small subunit [Moraxella bovis]UZA27760.1 type VI secretion system contractile sheath small subunit [Moraxella bovis]UZA37701.1 type VI secretion system contractile sheath small subunit [Moraxella bovis]